MDKGKPMHGMAKAKGCSHLRLGSFCKLFPDLPSWANDCDIQTQCEAEKIAELLGGAGGIMHDATSSSPDNTIPAAYTFFAQFIDHDITLDTTSELHGNELSKDEIKDLPNLRSASLDMDCLYGFGPEAMPFMYDQSQPGRMLIGNSKNDDDLPRNNEGRALIGDPRNDENIFVSQMQLLFLRFHNRRIIGRSFEDAQKDVRYHYQWIVLNDFLKRICDPEIYSYAIEQAREGNYPKCHILDHCNRVCMPVEFSVAAYRFGHTMVRSVYPANADYPVIDLFDERFGTEGFSTVPKELTVDWRFLLDVDDCHDYVTSKAIDHLLADELIRMPDPIVGRFASDNDRSLAFRNLLRGYALGLASGQRIAAALKDKGYPLNNNADLLFDEIPGWLCLDENLRKNLKDHTPLFFYLMREGGILGNGQHLGPVGSAILLEVFGAMLIQCDSFLKVNGWQPDSCVGGINLTLADIVRYVNSN
ncbi:Animal haem peroxidase [Nitrosomonas sp. Nm51]|uniref:peroxidase family protein n=1 Tax=Nitrosomonas sp. Nm51 TaxID=133720 RepID=UPI0008B0E12E|nr:heme peroxidase family protein [Nitrosomonas sp. Nm51]SER85214.1 Animal haem peroxidase [Nitrosomonas sp. Nm51]